MCNRQPLQSFSKGLIWVDIISSKATRRPAIWKVTSHFWLWAIEIVFHRQSIIADGRAGASRSKGPEFQSRSGSYESALQKNNLFDITVVAEDHEPSKGIVWEPLIGSGCRALYSPYTGRNSGGRRNKKITCPVTCLSLFIWDHSLRLIQDRM